MPDTEIALSVALGIGLAAATGFRVFLPLLVLAAAARWGMVPLGEGFAWLASGAALTMLAAAAIVEVAAYYIPGVDNLLDVLAGPLALAAGVMVSAAVMTDLPPMLKWTLAIIAGGGAAGLTQGATTFVRAHSTALTGGLGNPLVASLEIAGAVLVSVLALAAPYVALALVALFCVWALRMLRRLGRSGAE